MRPWPAASGRHQFQPSQQPPQLTVGFTPASCSSTVGSAASVGRCLSHTRRAECRTPDVPQEAVEHGPVPSTNRNEQRPDTGIVDDAITHSGGNGIRSNVCEH